LDEPTRDGSKRNQEEFNLPKRETLILVSGYNVQMRAKIIDRWQELEAQQVPTADPRIPKSFSEALLLAALKPVCFTPDQTTLYLSAWRRLAPCVI
jgi:hypothetical protein